jgi:transposase-like protein
MTHIPVRCPSGQSAQGIKGGKADTGKQRYRGHNPDGLHQSFLLDSADKGRLPAIKRQVIDRSRNGGGGRATARVWGISTTRVIQELKKRGCALPCAPSPDRASVPEPG